MGGKIAHYRTIDVEVLRKIVEDSFSYKEVLKRLGYGAIAGTYKYFKPYLDSMKISTTHFRTNGRSFERFESLNNDSLLCENSSYSRSSLKLYIIKKKLIEYKCESCPLTNEWQNKKLVLILDHINGINNDNRLQNLRFLCPNCNSQTDTFGARNFNTYKSKNIKSQQYKEQKPISPKDLVTKELVLAALTNNSNVELAAKELNLPCYFLRKKIIEFGLEIKKIRAKNKIKFKPIIKTIFSIKPLVKCSYSKKPKIKFKPIIKTIFSIKPLVKCNYSKKPKINKILLRTIKADTLIDFLKQHKTLTATAKAIGFSDVALKKRLKTLGIDYTDYNKEFNELDLINYYKETKSMDRVELKFKTSNHTIRAILKKHSIPILKPLIRIDKVTQDKIKQMGQKGYSISRISKELKMCRKTARRYLNN